MIKITLTVQGMIITILKNIKMRIRKRNI